MSDSTGTEVVYKEIIVCRHAVADEFGDYECGRDHEICSYTRRCAVCDRDVWGGPCPEHAPKDIPGLRLIECGNGHGRTWVVDDDGYEPPCPWCQVAAAVAEHRGCEHARHGRWRRWKATHRVALDLYSLGILKGHSIGYGGGCTGCVTHIRFGRNGYLLGWPRWKWRCLLVARHWPGEEVLRDMCGKCNPCGACGSERFGHNDGCPAVTA